MGIFTRFADWLAFSVFGLAPNAPLTSSVHFFIEDTAKIFVLLAAMVYAVAFLRAGLAAGRMRAFLAGRNRFLCYFLASALGAVTPFCSCSSIPLFLGFVAARIPVGIAMAFLITSPSVNEAAVAMLGGSLGWGLTGVYVGLGLLSGVAGGLLFDAIGAGRLLAAEIPCVAGGSEDCADAGGASGWGERLRFAGAETKAILGRIWPWVVAGIAIGAGLHGFVPDDFVASHLGGGEWWGVPLAVLIGIPTYANVTSVAPVAAELIGKGLPVGTAFAFMLATAAASVPEFVMLKKVMSGRLLALFAAYLLVIFTLCGWTLNFVAGR